jgi:hypothetical protein
MIIKKEQKGNVTVYYVDKEITDEKMESYKNKKVRPTQIKLIINDNADVYSKEGSLLLKFRKGKLPQNHINEFYDNVIDFASLTTNNRGSATGSKKKNVYDNPKIMTNIIGYFDTFSPKQKMLMTRNNIKLIEARETRFNMDYPDKYEKLLPLVKDIDSLYKKIIPDKYLKQKKKANQIHFKIPNTSFTTITTNVNFQTTIHKDVGDDIDGFGNLSVIEKGKYTGGETCFPQYGIGVNVRTGDILFMDVHEWHGNLPIHLVDKDAVRLSIVCYLRYKVWLNTKNKSKKFMIKHNKTVKNLRGK